MKRRKWALVLALAVLAACYGWRLHIVNSAAEQIPLETYETGEWLDFGDGYIIDDALENLDGYFARVDGAKIMTPNEYLAEYGEGDGATVPDGDNRTVLAVTMTIKNEYNEDGGFEAYLWTAIPDTLNTEYRYDSALFDKAEPMGSVFKVSKGREVTRTFPFTRGEYAPYFTDSAGSVQGEVLDDSFHLNMTFRPVTRRFVFSLDE